MAAEAMSSALMRITLSDRDLDRVGRLLLRNRRKVEKPADDDDEHDDEHH